jgi:hypothetical protein
MGLREWMSGFRRHRDPQRVQVPDMAEIRDLARAAAAYEPVPAASGSDGLHRSGFVDVRPSLLDGREMDGAAGLEPAGPADSEDRAAPWTHQWSPIEGGDLTPWMSPAEREQAAVDGEWEDPFPPVTRRPFPFTPTHEYVHEVYDPAPEGGPWRTERDEFMVVDRRAFSRESWEQGGSPDFHLGPTGRWWPDVFDGGPAFEPEDAPTALPWRYIPWRNEAGDWNTLAVQDEVEFIPRRDERSTAEVALDSFLPGWRENEGAAERVASAFGRWPAEQGPVDLEDAVHIARGDLEALPAVDGLDEVDDPARETSVEVSATRKQPPPVLDEDRLHPDYRAAQEEDRLDALDARREDEWAARERAAEALDRLAAANGHLLTESSPDAEAAAAEPVPEKPRRSRAADDELPPFDMDPIRPDVERDLEFGLE